MKKLRMLAMPAIFTAAVFPCSIDDSLRFIPGHRPEQLSGRFVKGELGILTPFLGKRYELIAWRYLSSLPLNADEQAAAAKSPVDKAQDGPTQRRTAQTSGGLFWPTKQSRIAPGEPDRLLKDIMSDDELKEEAVELRRLTDSGPAQAFVAPTVMAWAKAHPVDPQVPEALGRLVRMTRYGCRGIHEINGPISKGAFDMLHQKYPASDWANKTPYWFKD